VDRVCAVSSQHHRFNQIRQRLEIFGLAVFDLRDPIAASLPVTKAGFPVKNGSISATWPATSSRNTKWQNQVICVVGVLCLEGDRGR
jgi:hypothetical protein